MPGPAEPGQPGTPRLDPEIAHLVVEMMPQARGEAWRIYQAAPHALSLDDLTSLAYTGLVMAGARWPRYCAERGFSPGCGRVPCADPATCGTRYFAAYSLRRIRGSMLDALRSADWVTRSMRGRAKALREAGLGTGATEQELADATGLTPKQIRDTAAGVSARPVSFDAETHDVADASGVEEQVAVSSILAAVLEVMDQMDAQTQVIMALRFHQGRELTDIAVVLGITEQQVLERHNAGVLRIHDALLRAVTLPGGMLMTDLTLAEKAAARQFRASWREVMKAKNAAEPADITVSVFIRNCRHPCATQDGKSVNLELREHYLLSPPLEGGDGSAIPAGRFAFIVTEGRCPACGMTARSATGRLVDPGIRPPAGRAVAGRFRKA